jgi:hypothetical protein
VFRFPFSVFRFPCSGFRVPGSGFRVPGSVFRVPCSVFRVPCSVFRVPGSGFRVPGSGFLHHSSFIIHHSHFTIPPTDRRFPSTPPVGWVWRSPPVPCRVIRSPSTPVPSPPRIGAFQAPPRRMGVAKPARPMPRHPLTINPRPFTHKDRRFPSAPPVGWVWRSPPVPCRVIRSPSTPVPSPPRIGAFQAPPP